MRLRARFACVAVTTLVLAGCGGGSSSGATRTVLTDYDFDEFATSYFGYFPRVVPVHAGDTIDFRQAWTGEPHTITLGTAVKPIGEAVATYLTGGKAVPPDYPGDVSAAEQQLPSVFGDNNTVNQAAAAPCYVDRGKIPTDGKRCPVTTQPAFNGRQVFYNTGFIPYQGNNGNHFKLRLASDIAPGRYYFYCLLHGATMGGYLDVKPRAIPIASQAELTRQARAVIDSATVVLRHVHDRAREESGAPSGDIVAGASSPTSASGFTPPFVSLNEFSPRVFHAKVGQKVTWIVPNGPGHTISLDVPRYLPWVVFAKDGTVKLNPKAVEPQGGSPTPPRDTTASSGAPSGPSFTPIDAGNYDGSFFLSSGYPDRPILYSVTFTKAGTYDYACLLHPRMVGKVVVG